MPDTGRQLDLRIFLASPGDVADERALARAVVDQLRYDPQWRGRVTLDLVAWDKPGAVAMLATATPQASVAHQLPRPSECDIVIVIFWARVGTPLPPEFVKPDGTPYASGTEWEYLEAVEAAATSHRPRVLVYRRTEEPTVRPSDPDAQDRLRQWTWVRTFFARFRHADGSLGGGYNTYATPDDFRRSLERHLHDVIFDLTTSRDFVPAVALARRPLAPLWEGSPFPGLRAFTPADAPIFFGRGREIDDLVRWLGERTPRFLAVVGASGSGKSSLIAAGLIPRLLANALEGSRQWRYVRVRPAEVSDDLVHTLANALSPLDSAHWPPGRLADLLSAEPAAIARILGSAPPPADGAHLLLFLDQFEEVFTTRSGPERQLLMQVLVSLVTLPWLSVVITLRADFYARCVEIPELADLLRSGSYPLAAAGFDALFEMITRPAHRAGLVFDEGLPGRILAETGSDAGALPLMAFALQQLYEGRELSGRLTHEAYSGFGGVQEAIVARAESVFHSIAAPPSPASPDRAIATRRDSLGPHTLSDVFRELVQVEEGRTPTRKRAPLSRIARTPAAARLVELFVAARLLVAGGGDDPLIEVAHEALLTRWPRLSNWIETVFDDLRLRSQLQRAAREWGERDGDPAYLWSDERCVDAHTRLHRLLYTLSPSEARFLGPVDVHRILDELDDFATTPDQRALRGVRLALLGDPRRGVGLTDQGLPDLVWCDVPRGRITPTTAQPFLEIKPFRIAKYLLTRAQYDVFVDAPDGYHNPAWWDDTWLRSEHPGRQFQQYGNHPADNVSWFDAAAYCRWLTSRLGYQIRLPSEWEWQQAANGGDHRRAFPWGDWELGRANTYEAQLNRTTAVGLFPNGASPVGALDMCGNVWEWCANVSDLYVADANCPSGYRAVRGGSWNFVNTTARCDSPNVECSGYRFTSVGFRLAA